MNGIDKDTLEELRIIAIGNIQKYQVETRRWRDRKVKVRTREPRAPKNGKPRSSGQTKEYMGRAILSKKYQ